MVKSINIITNKDGRLDSLKDLFRFLNKSGNCRYSNGCLVVSTRINLHANSQPELIFQTLQSYSNRVGHMFNCYVIDL